MGSPNKDRQRRIESAQQRLIREAKIESYKKRVLHLVKLGEEQHIIAKRLGVSTTAIREWAQEAGLVLRS